MNRINCHSLLSSLPRLGVLGVSVAILFDGHRLYQPVTIPHPS